MATTTVTYFIEIDDVAQTGLTVVLSDPTSTYGVKRNDDDETVVADGTAMDEIGAGYYAHTFTDPDVDLTYTAFAEFDFDGETYNIQKIFSGSATINEPVTLAEAKIQCRVDGSADDTYLTTLIEVSRDYAERVLRRSLMTQTNTAYFDAFANVMEIPGPPLQSVTSITYTDTDGDSQTLSTSIYDVDTTVTPGSVRLAFDQSWPSTRATYNAVAILHVDGYGDASDVPGPIKQAMLLLICHWYENREATISGATIADVPMAVDSLLWVYRNLEAV